MSTSLSWVIYYSVFIIYCFYTLGPKSEAGMEDNSIRINGDDYPALKGWTKCASLWELDAVDFGTVTGLSTLEAADKKRKKINASRPLVRLIRSR